MMRWLSVLALFMLPAAAAAQNAGTPPVLVAEPAIIGLDPASATTFANLLRQAMEKQGYTVISRAQTPPTPCGEAACAVALEAQAHAQLAVVITLSQLGQKVIVQVTLTDAAGQTRFTDRVTAASIEDLDPLSTRIAAAIAQNKPIGETATVTTVTAQEARPNLRKQAMFTTGVTLGGGLAAFSSYGGATGLFDISFLGMWELNDFAGVLEASYRWDADNKSASVSGFNLDLGGRWFPSPEEDTGLYVGGGLGFRAIEVSPRTTTSTTFDGSFGTKSGLGGYVGGGVVFLRTSDLHFLVDARFDFNFFKAGDDSNLQSFIVSFGISFSKWHWF